MVRGQRDRSVGRLAYLVESFGDGTPHRLGEETSIGRKGDSNIVVDDPEVSRDHARVKYENERFVLYDLGSVNGTQLLRAGRTRRIHTPTPLDDTDVIILGRVQLTYFEVTN